MTQPDSQAVRPGVTAAQVKKLEDSASELIERAQWDGDKTYTVPWGDLQNLVVALTPFALDGTPRENYELVNTRTHRIVALPPVEPDAPITEWRRNRDGALMECRPMRSDRYRVRARVAGKTAWSSYGVSYFAERHTPLTPQPEREEGT